MNKISKSLIFCCFCLTTAFASTHTQKTYLQTRPFLSNLPMEYTTWHTQVNKKKIGPCNGSFQITPFYQKSENDTHLGEYFGYHAQNEDRNRDYINVEDTTGADNDALNSLDIIHYYNYTTGTLATGKFLLRPMQNTIGVRIDYYQALKRFFLKVSTPITYVRNAINPQVVGNLTNITSTQSTENAGKTILDYFKGNIETTTDTHNLQKKLKYAKIAGTHNTTGLGDIEIALGYNIYKSKGNHIKFGVDFSIPTGNEAKGEWLFEPISGNGGYWALGGFIDSKFVLWRNKKDRIEFLTTFDFQYLFENTEKRTLGIKDYVSGFNKTPLGHYYLAGKNAQAALFPAANILTQDIKVEPGVQIEGLIGLSFIGDNFTFDVGYDLFYKDKENLKLKHSWLDDTYALAIEDFDTATEGGFIPTVASGHTFGNSGPINSDNIDLEPAQSPTAFSNKIYCGLGYCFNNWKRPLMIGVGGAYEFHSGNTSLEGFEIWGKLGLSF